LAALQEFYDEQKTLASEEKTLKIDEDWQLSQFWYDDNTASVLAEEALRASSNGR